MANPLACRVALESVRMLLEVPFEERANRIEEVMQCELSELALLPYRAGGEVPRG